ncbi:hypothetical protein EDB84DRAFT_1572463 [Lactarius hengduanensis]|nr:hypothetical protein EDB84DRAFT_1572463 [Lactarius hengduanensis]
MSSKWKRIGEEYISSAVNPKDDVTVCARKTRKGEHLTPDPMESDIEPADSLSQTRASSHSSSTIAPTPVARTPNAPLSATAGPSKPTGFSLSTVFEDVVYTDGACSRNRQAGSVAGRRKPAIIRALQTAPTTPIPLIIKTDSKLMTPAGMVRINFQPYTTPQLEQIVHARLSGRTDVLSADAVKFAAMKVSSISSDARRVLDVCQRTVELVQLLGRANSPTAAFLRALALHERILLVALLECVCRTGVDEIPWADVRHQHHLYAGVLDALLVACVVLSEARGARRIVLDLEPAEVERVLGEVGGQQWRNMLAT